MADDREPLGRLAYETWGAWWREQTEQAGTVRPWEEIGSEQEMYMRVSSAVAAQAVKDAGLRNDRMEAQLFAFASVLPEILDALRFHLAHLEYEAQKKAPRAALKALGGSEGEVP